MSFSQKGVLFLNLNILSELKGSYEFLTKTEQIIADFLLNNPDKFTRLSIAQLSKILSVSQGSINNFSKKYSGKGFSELKLLVASCYAKTEPPFSDIDKSSSMKSVMQQRINESFQALNGTLEINSEKALSTAADMILNAKRIEIYGVYQSGIVARDLCYQLIQLGIPASYVTDTLMGAVAASMLDGDSLVIALSNSGQTKEILDSVEIAKNCGAKSLCITSNKHSPLADICECALFTTNSGSTISARYNEVRLSQMIIADTLCSYIRSVIDESGKRHYFKLEKILNSHSIKND